MEWKFEILNRFGILTEIDTPVGYTDTSISIKRDLNWHGVFFDNQDNPFEFFGKAAGFLKQEYDQFGVEGDMQLVVSVQCGNQPFEELQRGRFDFTRYEFMCDGCSVKIPIETISEVMDLRNRINQKVNLDTLVAFDNTTALPAYGGLGFNLSLPSKGIRLQDRAETKAPSIEFFESGLQPVTNGTSPHSNLTLTQIEFGLPDNVLSEIGSFQIGPTHTQNFVSQNGASFIMALSGQGVLPLQCNPILNYYPGSPNYGDVSSTVHWDIRLKGSIELQQTYMGNCRIFLLRLRDRPGYAANGSTNIADYDVLADFPVVTTAGCGILSCMYFPGTGPIYFDHSFVADVPLYPRDRYYLFMATTERKTQTEIDYINSGAWKAYKLTLDTVSHIHIGDVSHTPPTTSKAYLVNEAISRVCEAITNDKLRSYSEYFGRTDSEPYAVGADGCGSLEVVTDGLRIRRAESIIPGTTSLFTLSMQDLFNGLSPIHNIGIGVEPDPARLGFNRLRVEQWSHFYENVLIMSCPNAGAIRKKVQAKEIYSIFKFGFNKWEAEYYNGLDEFLTKREYRTTLKQVKGELTKLSTFVGSGYALEITRRIRSDVDTKDWRYDKETFIICCTRERFFHARFIPQMSGGQIVVDFNEPGAPFSGATITVANSQFNDGTYPVFSYVYDSVTGTVTINVTTAVIAEDSYGVTFPGVIFPPSINVELGNVENPENITDPGSLYNFRITPLRNAMRWLNKIFTSYKVFGPANSLQFTDGDGNYFAKGKMKSAVCRYENAAFFENATLDTSLLTDPNKAKPFLAPERITYDYPMSLNNFKQIKANPKGKIFYSGVDAETGACLEGYGFIDTIVYKPEDGVATFNLIPKINE